MYKSGQKTFYNVKISKLGNSGTISGFINFSHNTKTHFWVSMQTAPTIMLHAQQKDCNCANAAEGIGPPLAAELTSVGLVFILLNTVTLMIVPIPEN